MLEAIGNAVAILSDVEKRKQYDMYGPEDERMQTQAHQNHTHYNYTRGFESTDEILLVLLLYYFCCIEPSPIIIKMIIQLLYEL